MFCNSCLGPQQKRPGHDVRNALEHNDRLVPAQTIPGYILADVRTTYHLLEQVCEEEDGHQDRQVGVGPHRVDVLVHLQHHDCL